MTHPNAASRHLRAVTEPVHGTAHEHPPVNGSTPDPTADDPTTTVTASEDAAPGVDPGEARALAEIARARAALPPIDPAAFDCYLGTVVDAVAEWTEGDPVNVLASLLCVAGVHLGQGPHVRAGDDVHPLLVWPLIVGRTNSGRKGAGWSSAKRIATTTAPDFMTTNLRSGLTSGEGLAAMFTDDPTEKPANDDDTGDVTRARRAGGRLPPGDRRLLVFEAEWAGVMARMKREGNSLSATLRGAWEGGDLSTLTVTSRIAPTSHIGILAHITPEEFRAKVSASDLAGGTYNRFLPVMVSRSQFLPGGQGAPDLIVKGLGADMAERLESGGKLGSLGFTPAGTELWRKLYVEFGSDHGDTPQVEQFISRAAPNCLRIAAIHAALDQANAIDAHHLVAAAALVRYSIASARTALTNASDAGKLIGYLTAAGAEGRTRDQIRSECFHRNKTVAEVQPMLDQLVASDQVVVTKRPPAGGKGRPAEVFTIAAALRE